MGSGAKPSGLGWRKRAARACGWPWLDCAVPRCAPAECRRFPVCFPPVAPVPARLSRLTSQPQTQSRFALISSCFTGDSSLNTTQAPDSSPAPSLEQPPTVAETRAAPEQGDRPAAQGLPPRLNLTGAVRVLCEIEKVAIAIERRFLQQESIPESSLYLGHPSCNVSDSNSTHVFLVAGWSECGTLVQSVSPGCGGVQAVWTSVCGGDPGPREDSAPRGL